jgi:hypothetical protein
MIVIPILDLIFFAVTSYFAIANRGTTIGWICTFALLYQTYQLVSFYLRKDE